MAQQWVLAFDHNFGLGGGSQPTGFVGTDPRTPFPGTVFSTNAEVLLPLQPNPPGLPNNFEAIHMALIPKGPFRGHVVVWTELPVFGVPPQDPQHVWSFQAWSIVNPTLDTQSTTPRFRNFFLPIAAVANINGDIFGDNLFCAGHTWTPDGDLVVVGGTRWNGGQQFGAKWIFIFDPTQPSAPFPAGGLTAPLYSEAGMWLPDTIQLASSRYYPTAVLTHSVPRLQSPGVTSETIGVFGGDTDEAAGFPSHLNVGLAGQNPTWNSYETLVIRRTPLHPQFGTPRTGLAKDSVGSQFNFDGPGQPSGNPDTDWLWFYPRVHLLSSGFLFVSGFAPEARALHHDIAPTVNAQPQNRNWLPLPSGSGIPSPNNPSMRTYGSTVRFPNVFGNTDIIVRLGGVPFITANMNPVHATASVEFCDTTQTNPTWVATLGSQSLAMHHPRAVANAVLLPDASIAVFGGATALVGDPPVPTPVMDPEIFTAGVGWVIQPQPQSPRTYHSTAMLLPDGRVLVSGSDQRTIDYEIFEPAYLQQGYRPTNVTVSDGSVFVTELDRGQRVQIDCDALPFGVFISRIVLMAPGSTTHHSDMSQRYHQLTVDAGGANSVKVDMPLSDRVLPSGFYMLFAVTNTGVPSEAVWIKLKR